MQTWGIAFAVLVIVALWLPSAIRYFRHRRAIRSRLREITVTRRQGGIAARSLCCGATCQPLGWSQDGWIASCRRCGTWQYLGDDHANPPPGFRSDGRPEGFVAGGHIYAMEKDGVRTEVTSERYHRDWGGQAGDLEYEMTTQRPGGYATGGVISCNCDHDGIKVLEHAPTCPLRPYRVGETRVALSSGRPAGPPTIKSEETGNVYQAPPGFGFIGDLTGFSVVGCELCGGELEHTADCPRAIVIDMMPDQNECPREDDLTLPPMPNMGGEGNPDYQGPHYNSVHGLESRFVPYDMLHDPIPGTAVHKVGDVACVGPLAVEQKIMAEHEQTVETAKSEGNFYGPDADNR